MLTIAKLFGKSPFTPLKTHMAKVAACIKKLEQIFQNLGQGKEIGKQVKELCLLEKEADTTKNDIRNHLPKSLFMPMDRRQFLELLSFQDAIADATEEVGLILLLRPLAYYSHFEKEVSHFFTSSIETFIQTKRIIEEIEDLLESSFGGLEAAKVKQMVEEVASKEERTKEQGYALSQRLFSSDLPFSVAEFSQWEKLIGQTKEMARFSEKLANKIRTLLELK